MKIKKDMEKSILSFIPLLIIVGIVPLIVRLHLVSFDEVIQYFWPNGSTVLDCFSYNKYIALVINTSLATIIYLYYLINNKIEHKLQKRYMIPIILIIITTILSTIFSEYKSIALFGFPDMMQGVFVLLAYMLIIVIVSTQIDSEKQIKWFVIAIAFMISIEGFIGISQYFGFDIFQTKFGEMCIVPSDINLQNGLQFTFGPKNIYGTLFNTNFVGSFGVLVVPIAFYVFMIAKDKRWKLVNGIILFLAIFTLFGSNSRAGYLGGILALIFTIIMLHKMIIKYWKKSLVLLISSVVIFSVFNIISDGHLINRFESMLSYFNSTGSTTAETTEKLHVNDIKIDGYSIIIDTNLQNAHIAYKEGKIGFIENDVFLPVKKDIDGFYYLEGAENKYISFLLTDNSSLFSIKIGEKTFPIYITDSFKIVGLANKLYLPENPDKIAVLDKYGSVASGRGYIWSRSIPIIKNTIIYGAGPDCYTIAFPQDDVVGKINYLDTYNMIVDKPHNMYIQMAINTGLISLIAFLFICVLYIVSSIKILWQSKYETNIEKLCLAIVVSIVGYLAAGMFNDQINSVAPVFYVLFGLGIATNRMCIAEKERQAYMASKKK